MNTKFTPHVMQAVKWSKYDLQGWLNQFGYWLGGSSSAYRGNSENPIAIAMKRAKVSLKKSQRAALIASYICDDEFKEKISNRKCKTCRITDDEARAVQKLVLDVINNTQSDVMLDWMRAIVDRYFSGCSWTEMSRPNRTEMDAKFDVRCGLAALHAQYPFIPMDKKCA